MLEGWPFPHAVSSRNDMATDFHPLLRGEPRAMMPTNTVAGFPPVPTKSLWTFHPLLRKLQNLENHSASSICTAPFPENTPKIWLQLWEIARLSPLSNQDETQRSPRMWLRAPKWSPYSELLQTHLSLCWLHRGWQESALGTRPALLSNLQLPNNSGSKREATTDALAATLLTTSTSHFFSSSGQV